MDMRPSQPNLGARAAQANALGWSKERLQYVPHPATWLNGERWLDEVPGIPTRVDRHPTWALNAGFANIDEAHNERCYQRNAHEFRDGKRIQEAMA